MAVLTEERQRAFWRKVNTRGSTPEHVPHLGPCWEWTGARRVGYGALVVGYNEKGQPIKASAHRLSWQLHNSEIPDGLFVCHHCDNRLCVRPDHLFLGTIRENGADMVRKGRQVKGERVNTCQLTEAQAAEVKRLSDAGVRQQSIADMFGIGQSTVSAIVCGQSWKHLKLVQGG